MLSSLLLLCFYPSFFVFPWFRSPDSGGGVLRPDPPLASTQLTYTPLYHILCKPSQTPDPPLACRELRRNTGLSHLASEKPCRAGEAIPKRRLSGPVCLPLSHRSNCLPPSWKINTLCREIRAAFNKYELISIFICSVLSKGRAMI